MTIKSSSISLLIGSACTSGGADPPPTMRHPRMNDSCLLPDNREISILPPHPAFQPPPHLPVPRPFPWAQTLTALPPQGNTVHCAVLGLLAPVLQWRLDAEGGSGNRGRPVPGVSAPHPVQTHIRPPRLKSAKLGVGSKAREVPSAPRVSSRVLEGWGGFWGRPGSSLSLSLALPADMLRDHHRPLP